MYQIDRPLISLFYNPQTRLWECNVCNVLKSACLSKGGGGFIRHAIGQGVVLQRPECNLKFSNKFTIAATSFASSLATWVSGSSYPCPLQSSASTSSMTKPPATVTVETGAERKTKRWNFLKTHFPFKATPLRFRNTSLLTALLLWWNIGNASDLEWEYDHVVGSGKNRFTNTN